MNTETAKFLSHEQVARWLQDRVVPYEVVGTFIQPNEKSLLLVNRLVVAYSDWTLIQPNQVVGACYPTHLATKDRTVTLTKIGDLQPTWDAEVHRDEHKARQYFEQLNQPCAKVTFDKITGPLVNIPFSKFEVYVQKGNSQAKPLYGIVFDLDDVPLSSEEIAEASNQKHPKFASYEGHCPTCDSVNTKWDDFEITSESDQKGFQEGTCKSCGAIWTEHWTCSDIEITKEGKVK